MSKLASTLVIAFIALAVIVACALVIRGLQQSSAPPVPIQGTVTTTLTSPSADFDRIVIVQPYDPSTSQDPAIRAFVHYSDGSGITIELLAASFSAETNDGRQLTVDEGLSISALDAVILGESPGKDLASPSTTRELAELLHAMATRGNVAPGNLRRDVLTITGGSVDLDEPGDTR